MKSGEKLSNWKVIGNMIPYIWPRNNFGLRIRVIISILALVLAKVSTVATPLVMIWTVDSLITDETAAEPTFLIGIGSFGLVVSYGLMRLLSVGFNQLRDGIFVVVGQRALRELALRTFSHIHSLSLRFHISRKTGALSRIIERGVKGIDFLLRFIIFSIFPLILELFFVGLLLFFRYEFTYVLVIFVTIILYFWFTLKVTDLRLKIRERMNRLDTEANQKAIDSLINYETVKFFGAESNELQRYDESMKGYEQAAVWTGVSLALLNFGQAVLITIGLVVVMLLAAQGVNNGDISVGEFVGVNAIMIQLIMPLNFLGTVYREIRQSLVDMSDMFELLNEPLEITDKRGALASWNCKGAVKFKNVKFGYSESRTILDGITFEVEVGQTLAIVGSSGSGKSTIGRLLFRFYEVSDGSITIDGHDVRDLKQESLRKIIGVVPQDTVLFNDTIGYNIAYGKPNATSSEIESAAKAARIYDFVLTLPDGFNTLVGERGLKLSGGEKQRVGIARTFLKNPAILLLDEATSALDSETEKEIQKSLKSVSKGRSVLTVAHRLSTIRNADKIIVLNQGKIVEQGLHSGLLKLQGHYYRMWNQQLTEEFNDKNWTAEEY